MLSLFENGGGWDFPSQEKSSNPSYYQSKDCSKVDWKDFYDRYCSSAGHFNFNCHSQAQWLSLKAWLHLASRNYVLGCWNSQGSDCFNREMKMSFIAQYFEKLNIITVLEGRTQAVIRNHFQAVFQTFLKDKEKIINALESLYSKAKLEFSSLWISKRRGLI